MAYITKKKINGTIYYYAEQREWKDGKSRRKWQKYLGSIDTIIKSVEGKSPQPSFAELFCLGDIGAYLSIANDIKIVQIINNMLPKKNQGLSIGDYIQIAAINRGTGSVSKNSMWDWFKGTLLLNYYSNIKASSLSSQRFWDNMDLIPEDMIKDIWMEIINRVIINYKIDLSQVSYDGTNFYTFISTFNVKNTIAQRGKNKQGRSSLRQVSYALFCSKEDHIPLYFDVYKGNKSDSKEFLKIIPDFIKSYKGKVAKQTPITIVFDKGNNSPANIGLLDGSEFNFVASAKLNEHKELAEVSNKDERFTPFDHENLDTIKAFKTIKEIYGKQRTVIVTFNSNLYNDQMCTINNDIKKCFDKLSELKQRLSDRAKGVITKGRKPTVASVKKSVNEILSRQYMKEIIQIDYSEKNQIPLINFMADGQKLAKIADTYLGKKIIFTDNHHWQMKDIIIAYNSQYVIEHAFREMKTRKNSSWWPMFHYTDQKIKVHGLYCTITLLIRSLMQRKVRQANLKISIDRVHEKLKGIKEVVNFFENSNSGKKGKKITKNHTLTKMDSIQKKLYDIFKISDYSTFRG